MGGVRRRALGWPWGGERTEAAGRHTHQRAVHRHRGGRFCGDEQRRHVPWPLLQSQPRPLRARDAARVRRARAAKCRLLSPDQSLHLRLCECPSLRRRSDARRASDDPLLIDQSMRRLRTSAPRRSCCAPRAARMSYRVRPLRPQRRGAPLPQAPKRTRQAPAKRQRRGGGGGSTLPELSARNTRWSYDWRAAQRAGWQRRCEGADNVHVLPPRLLRRTLTRAPPKATGPRSCS